MLNWIKNKKAFNEEIIKLIALIILFVLVGAVAIYLLKNYGII